MLFSKYDLLLGFFPVPRSVPICRPQFGIASRYVEAKRKAPAFHIILSYFHIILSYCPHKWYLFRWHIHWHNIQQTGLSGQVASRGIQVIFRIFYNPCTNRIIMYIVHFLEQELIAINQLRFHAKRVFCFSLKK